MADAVQKLEKVGATGFEPDAMVLRRGPCDGIAVKVIVLDHREDEAGWSPGLGQSVSLLSSNQAVGTSPTFVAAVDLRHNQWPGHRQDGAR